MDKHIHKLLTLQEASQTQKYGLLIATIYFMLLYLYLYGHFYEIPKLKKKCFYEYGPVLVYKKRHRCLF